MRPSTRLRLALAERDYALAEGAPAPDLCRLLAANPSAVRNQVIPAVIADAHAAINRLRLLMNHEAFPEIVPGEITFQITEAHGSVFAEVGLDERAKPAVTVSAGLILALEDALLAALCRGAFFTNGALENDGLDEPIPFLEVRNPNPMRMRFYDVGGIEQLTSSEIQKAIPRAPWRLCQFDLLSELALHFILLHEVAHFACGHLGLAAVRRGTTGAFRLSEIDHEFALGPGGARSAIFQEADHKCIELQADFLAEELHFFFHRADKTEAEANSALARYAEVLPELVDVRGAMFVATSPAQR